MPRRLRFRALLLLLALLFLLPPPPASAFYFRLSGDRLWLDADNVPLADILDAFADLGVRVRIDPGIVRHVTASLRGRKLDEALPRLLGGCDYLLAWDRLPGPLGRIPKLREIAVFETGSPASDALPLRRAPKRFPVTRGVTGTAPEFVPGELLLGVRHGTTYPQFQRLLDETGGMIVAVEPRAGVYLVRFPEGTNTEALLDRLRKNPLLALAELNHVARLPAAPAPSPASPADAARALAATLAATPAPGSPLLAVLDTGFDPTSPYAPVAATPLDATQPDTPITDPDGHGTAISLLASGLVPADGMAPAGTDTLRPVIPVKTCDDQGATTSFTLLLALAYAAESGARVVNMSWGTSVDSTALRAAVASALDSGLLLVASAGNEATDAPTYPAALDGVLSVAATQDGRPWTSSNHGPAVDLAASATADIPLSDGTGWQTAAGTSISSAVVANALARYFALHPDATRADALSALDAALSPPVAEGYGRGTLDAPALSRLLAAP
jgi:hypothetical protein